MINMTKLLIYMTNFYMTNIDMTFYLNHMTHICITYHILTKYGSLLLCKILGNVCYYFSMLHIMSIVH